MTSAGQPMVVKAIGDGDAQESGERTVKAPHRRRVWAGRLEKTILVRSRHLACYVAFPAGTVSACSKMKNPPPEPCKPLPRCRDLTQVEVVPVLVAKEGQCDARLRVTHDRAAK